jgi:hypothetical protein
MAIEMARNEILQRDIRGQRKQEIKEERKTNRWHACGTNSDVNE